MACHHDMDDINGEFICPDCGQRLTLMTQEAIPQTMKQSKYRLTLMKAGRTPVIQLEGEDISSALATARRAATLSCAIAALAIASNVAMLTLGSSHLPYLEILGIVAGLVSFFEAYHIRNVQRIVGSRVRVMLGTSGLFGILSLGLALLAQPNVPAYAAVIFISLIGLYRAPMQQVLRLEHTIQS